VREYVPLALSKKDDSIATQYTMGVLEELGLLKMDFLGLRNLTIIDDAVQEIRKTKPDFSIDSIPDNDEATFAMISAGKTSGVFQLESQGMTAVCTGLGPKSIEDITAIIALYRPGPMDSIPRFLDWSQNPDKISYAHPLLEPILNVTYGCIVYQEQVIDIFRKIAGFSLGQADMIRRAMSKKIREVINREKEAFIGGDPERGICGAVASGVPKAVASGIYDDIFAFADYAFNKAHAAAYAIISYQTAFLKCHYPQIYMAALLSSILGNRDMVAEYTESCRLMGINLLPPNINESEANFTVSGKDLRYGLVAVKNIGRGFISSLVTEREKNGAFTSFEDFCRRMHGSELNKRAVESLIKCGCFDGLGANRRQLIMIHQTVLDGIANDRRRNVEGQMDMFGMSQDDSGADPTRTDLFDLPDFSEFSKKELMSMEREVTGLYLCGHPMDEYRETVKKAGAVGISDILADFARETGNVKFTDNQKITVAGVIESVRTRMTRNNSTMAHIALDDGFGTIELLAFQQAIDKSGSYMVADNAVIVSGRLSARDEKEPQIVVDTLCLIRNSEFGIRNSVSHGGASPPKGGRTLYVKIDSEHSEAHDLVRLAHKNFLGSEDMIIHFADTRKTVKGACSISEEFVVSLTEMLGSGNVVVKGN
jgi:DNA polymerase-3 subunit alpha